MGLLIPKKGMLIITGNNFFMKVRGLDYQVVLGKEMSKPSLMNDKWLAVYFWCLYMIR